MGILGTAPLHFAVVSGESQPYSESKRFSLLLIARLYSISPG